MEVDEEVRNTKRYYYDLYIKIFDAVKELFIEIDDIDVEEEGIREIYLVATERYFKGIVERVAVTEHIESFKTFYEFISSVKLQ